MNTKNSNENTTDINRTAQKQSTTDTLLITKEDNQTVEKTSYSFFSLSIPDNDNQNFILGYN